MSTRLTTTQVIEQGRYLDPDFEASSLTVSQLMGVLLHHHVKFPTPYSKPKLVQIFNEEIKSKLSPLKRQRLKQESSIASDYGITDGVTGQPLTSGSESKVSVSRFDYIHFADSVSSLLHQRGGLPDVFLGLQLKKWSPLRPVLTQYVHIFIVISTCSERRIHSPNAVDPLHSRILAVRRVNPLSPRPQRWWKRVNLRRSYRLVKSEEVRKL